MLPTLLVLVVSCLLGSSSADGTIQAADIQPKISNERVVFQLEQGDVEFAFFPEVTFDSRHGTDMGPQKY